MKTITYEEAKVWDTILEGTMFTLYLRVQNPCIEDMKGKAQILSGVFPAVLTGEELCLATGLPEFDNQALEYEDYEALYCEVL